MAQNLRHKIQHEVTLITLSEEGMFIGNHEKSFLIPTTVRNISDVSGAGDTVISIVSLCFLKKVPLERMGWIANVAGGQVCELPGVVPVNLSQLKEELKKSESEHSTNKL
jgi:bifunctional ADP-heptose synthase (sugar kinase/adenylyltransferase)